MTVATGKTEFAVSQAFCCEIFVTLTAKLTEKSHAHSKEVFAKSDSRQKKYFVMSLFFQNILLCCEPFFGRRKIEICREYLKNTRQRGIQITF
jgi:hypothetical protein